MNYLYGIIMGRKHGKVKNETWGNRVFIENSCKSNKTVNFLNP